MPINTENSGMKPAVGTCHVRMFKKTTVHSAGGNVLKGEIVEVSEDDARFLVSYGYAERVQARSIETPVVVAQDPAEPQEPAEESSSTGVQEPETSTATAAPTGRRFTRRRDK